jgi:hypothetical protein
MILGEAIKTTLFVRNLLVEMGFPQHIGGPTPMQGDNWPATTLIPEQRLTERNRFFVTDFHFANEAYELQEIITGRKQIIGACRACEQTSVFQLLGEIRERKHQHTMIHAHHHDQSVSAQVIVVLSFKI